MLYKTDLGNARMNDLLTTAQRSQERRALRTRGSPTHRYRLVLAHLLVRTGARLHGNEAAVIGRVVILDQCGHAPQELRSAA